MKADDLVETFRSMAADAISSHDAIMELWRKLPVAETARHCDQTDVELLSKLIKYRIYPANAFELLARVDLDRALEALLRRYVGVGVSADRKFGGYYFELSVMIDDLKEIAGEQALRRLISLDGFDRGKLTDPRVVSSFTDALDIEPKDFNQWLDSAACQGNQVC